MLIKLPALGNTRYNIGGNHALSASGTDDFFAGARSSAAPGEGTHNAFVGAFAGLPTSGNNNTIVGAGAGQNNSIGGGNSFFGTVAGAATFKHNNSFFGTKAGEANTNGQERILSSARSWAHSGFRGRLTPASAKVFFMVVRI